METIIRSQHILPFSLAFALISLSGCSNDGYYHYRDTSFTVNEDQVISVRLILTSNDAIHLISRIEVNHITLDLEDVTPKKWKSFLDEAKIEYTESALHKIIEDKGVSKCTFMVEDGIPNIYLQDHSKAKLTIRSTGKTVTLPFPRSELIAKFGKPDSIKTNRSRQP